MANTFVAIAKNVLTSSAASVTFSSIPQTYTDLYLLAFPRQTGTGGAYIGTAKVEFNAATTNFSYLEMFSNGTSVGGAISASASFVLRYSGDGATADTFGSGEIYIPNYTRSAYKIMAATSVAENNSATNSQTRIAADAGLWSDTSAITSITLTPSSGSIDTGSSFYLYGIKSS